MNHRDTENAEKEFSALSAENWPFDLKFLPESAYMVGGAVRDALLGRKRDYLDLDFIIPETAVKVARKIATHYKAGFVLLDPQRQIARVVFPHATADFAQQEGDSLETDLRRRDFTMNAIAYHPHTNQLIDPLQGYTDLKQSLIRMISPANLQDDPLRLLRAYRQAAQLGFTVEPKTRFVIQEIAHLLGKVAAERVRVELGYLLNSSSGIPWLTAAWEDGLINIWLSHATEKSFRQLVAVDSAATTLVKIWPQLEIELSQAIKDTIKTPWLSLAKLACLVTNDPILAEAELQKLSYSRAEIKGVTAILKLLPQLHLKQDLTTEMSLREQYFLFREAGKAFPIVAVSALATGISLEGISPLINRYLTPNDRVAHPIPLITGNDLIKALDLKPSPKLGELLTEIQIARIEGKISSLEEAIAFATHLNKQESSGTVE
ncbi:[cytidine(C)-cytidine(C)-adenosine (A)]-adding enzyme [[Phormidium ambiguum] IAM M-71]|uniref:[cytidine(C)-cytidine(C)-adenosine (A)]-adding enzyme n=1 Tax=[Phormidium ambiguum] IAM M-71 TaxID=454136 RepID=A0A1U7II87_9CYAN|nr:CCA tRNA nucleotidyltransferase [Phormidium ambiguum]OKH36886.1 [cytidine(C)-cytidine(C)-adenosine (A)]-adding enzyme [Phormidium ambiguum IAM M-71]